MLIITKQLARTNTPTNSKTWQAPVQPSAFNDALHVVCEQFINQIPVIQQFTSNLLVDRKQLISAFKPRNHINKYSIYSVIHFKIK